MDAFGIGLRIGVLVERISLPRLPKLESISEEWPPPPNVRSA